MAVDQRQAGEAPGAGQGHASPAGTSTAAGQKAAGGRELVGGRGREGRLGRVGGHGSVGARTDSSAAGSPVEQGLGAVARRLVGPQALEAVLRRLGERGGPREGVQELVASVLVVASAEAAGRAAVGGRRSGCRGSPQVVGGQSQSDWGRWGGAWLLPPLSRGRQGRRGAQARAAKVAQGGRHPPGKGERWMEYLVWFVYRTAP